MITDRNTVIKIFTSIDGVGKLYVAAKRKINKIKFSAADISGKTYEFIFDCGKPEGEFAFNIENPILWSIDEPNLYSYILEIYGVDEETVKGKFAFRTISTDGKNVLLNGLPIFVK